MYYNEREKKDRVCNRKIAKCQIHACEVCECVDVCVDVCIYRCIYMREMLRSTELFKCDGILFPEWPI